MYRWYTSTTRECVSQECWQIGQFVCYTAKYRVPWFTRVNFTSRAANIRRSAGTIIAQQPISMIEPISVNEWVSGRSRHEGTGICVIMRPHVSSSVWSFHAVRNNEQLPTTTVSYRSLCDRNINIIIIMIYKQYKRCCCRGAVTNRRRTVMCLRVCVYTTTTWLTPRGSYIIYCTPTANTVCIDLGPSSIDKINSVIILKIRSVTHRFKTL